MRIHIATDHAGLEFSTQLVHHHYIRQRPTATPPEFTRTIVDRLDTAVSRT